VGAQVGAGGVRGRRQSALAEINVTPLVDVMLVLLIISRVAAPMLERSIQLQLPETETASDIAEARVVVSMDREGRLRVNERPVHPELLRDQMARLAVSRPGETVYLRADKLLPYGEVLTVMDMIRRAGVTRVALVTVPIENRKGG
jgi:biopolymer transport protein ExbD/biopolymer transport protein TolR